MIILTDKTLIIPVGISPNYAGTSSKVDLEDKSVEITENGDYNYTAGEAYYGIGNFNVKVNVEGHYESDKTVNPSFVDDVTVTPSEGFDAMSSVIVKKAEANLQDKTVDKASTSQIVLTADEGYQGLGTVTVAPIKTKTVSADPSTNVQEFSANTENNEYITSVTVNPVNTRSINVDPSTNSQVVNAPENEYITSVTVNPVGTKTVTVDSSTNAQTVNANVEGNEYITSVTVNPVKTKSLSITPRLVEQTFTAEQELYKTVNVSAVKYTEKTYDASTNTQTYDYTQNDYTFIKNLTINPVTSNIDPNIVPENIAKGVSILGVTGNLEAGSTPPTTPTEAYAIRQDYNDGDYIAYPINVRLTTDSWVSFDFAMSDQALSQYGMPILGVSDNTLKLYIEERHLFLDIGYIKRAFDYILDTARHNISFGFAGVVDPANENFRFKVEIDNVEIYNGYVTAPNFNLPLFLFGCPSEYNGTYEDYEHLGGIPFLLNEIGITFSSNYFYIFGLKVYNVNSLLQRYLIRDYEPTIDAEQKPCLLEKLSNEYEYPTLGKFMYVSVPNVPVKEIANSDYGSEPPQQCYIKPSAGAIVPTDIKLTPTTQIFMKIGYIDDFGEVSADKTEEEILKSRVMLGAQPNLLISAYDENDIRRGLPGYAESHSISTDDLIWQMLGGKGIYFGGSSNILYSTSDTDGNSTQYIFGNDKLYFGYDVVAPEDASINFDNLNKILTTNYYDAVMSSFNKKVVSPTYSQFNNEMNTPICFFGNYNETTMKPDEVIALGYQEALSQIGYTTGIRYSINRIEIYDRDSDGSISRKHMLVPATNVEGVNYLKDVVTGSSYYPYKGTLDVTSGTPIQDTVQDNPTHTILNNTYIKPSAGAIVPTDIKLPTLQRVTMYIKDIDAFDEALDSSITGQAALDIVKDRVMIGAQPDFIAPLNHVDYERNLPGLPITNEFTSLLGDSSIAFYYQGSQEDGLGGIFYSLYHDYSPGAPQVIPSLTGEHTIKFGQRAYDTYNLWTFFIIDDNQKEANTLRRMQNNVIDSNKKMTPLCIFGTYNFVEGKTPEDIIALGYQNALDQIGYKTGVRYAVKRIDIEDYGTDTSTGTAEPIATVHSLVPARDSNGTICLYDTVSNKSYYPFHGTLDII